VCAKVRVLPILALTFKPANPALRAAILSHQPISVVAFAMERVVLARSNADEMRGIHTRLVLADVMEVVRDRPDEQFIGRPMCENVAHAPTATTQHAVAASESSSPQPALIATAPIDL